MGMQERDTSVCFVGLKQLKLMLKLALVADVPAAIWSRAGIGKTEMMESISKELDWLYFDFRVSDKEPSDLAGIPTPSPEGKVRWLRPDGIPFQDDIGDRYAIFHIDEIDRIDNPALYHVLLQVIQERRANNIPLGSNVRIVTCGNGDTDEHTHPMYDAIASRLCHIYVSASDSDSSDSWQEWASRNRVGTGIRYWMQTNWSTVLNPTVEKNFTNLAVANPRSVVNAGKLVKTFFALDPEKQSQYRGVMQPLISGCIGTKLGASLWATAKMQKVVRLEEILGKPLQAHVPDDMASRYTIVYNLTDRLAPSLADMDDAKARDKILKAQGDEPRYAEALRDSARKFAAKHFPAALAYVMRFEPDAGGGELAMAFASRCAALNDVVVTTDAYAQFMKDRNRFMDTFIKTHVDVDGAGKPSKKKPAKKAKSST